MTASRPPRVSVIIPTYNRAHLVGRAIRSVLAQTFQDFEIIVVDDASTDNTEEVVQSFNDARVRYLCHGANRGGGAARNTGLRSAHGQYASFLDSDDEWLPHKLERQIQVFLSRGNSCLDAVGCGALKTEGRSLVALRLPLDGSLFEDLLSLKKVREWSVTALLIRRDCLVRNRIEFDEDMRPISEDRDFMLRLARVCSFAYVDEPLIQMNDDAPQKATKSDNYEGHLASRIKLLEKYREELEKRPRVLAVYYTAIATLHHKLGNLAATRAYLRHAAMACPCPEHAVLWASSLFGNRFFKATLFGRALLSLSWLARGV